MAGPQNRITHPIRVCVAGADGRMGSALLRDLEECSDIQVSGVLTASTSPHVGRRLGELSLAPPHLVLWGPEMLRDALSDAEVYVSFTTPKAELENIPRVVEEERKIVMGTTGFKGDEKKRIETLIETRVPAVISPNFSIGINLLTKLTRVCEALPKKYDFSLIEIHHKGKSDAPSGTAKLLESIIKETRGYTSTTHGRKGFSRRGDGELEVSSLRMGGVPGIHEVMIAGKHELLRIQHTAFSRSVFANGAITAIRWISKIKNPGVYSMDDVLSQTPG